MNDTANPKISIIILNWNGKSVTSECLDSLAKVNYDNFRVILVDNGSEDGSQGHFKNNYGWVTFIENTNNLGFAGGNNVGIRYALRAGTDYILLLNNDTIVDSMFLEKLKKVGESDNEIGILNPKIYYYDNPKTIWYGGGKFSLLGGVPKHIGRKEMDKGQYDDLREVNYTTGCALLIKRQVIDKIGLLDENLFVYAEDMDWSLRASRAGYKAMYVPSSIIWHKEGMASRRNKDEDFRLYWATRNIMYVVYKNFTPLQFSLFLFFYSFRWLLYMTLKAFLTGNYRGMVSIYSGFMDFWPMRKNAPKEGV